MSKMGSILYRHCKHGNIRHLQSLLAKYPSLTVLPDDKPEKCIVWPVRGKNWRIVEKLLEYHIKHYLVDPLKDNKDNKESNEYLHAREKLRDVIRYLHELSEDEDGPEVPQEIYELCEDYLPAMSDGSSSDGFDDISLPDNDSLDAGGGGTYDSDIDDAEIDVTVLGA